MSIEKTELEHAVVYGAPSERCVLYVHGKLGSREDGAFFAEQACKNGWQVFAMDLPGHGVRKNEAERFVPWEVVPELREAYAYLKTRYGAVSLCANSIGAYFSMLALHDAALDGAMFVSPILDMARLIRRMMEWASVTEEQLEAAKEIQTQFGETLSWRYFCYAREHALRHWNIPTAILYGGRDHLTERETVDAFLKQFGGRLTVMEDGAHWFHTEEQLAVLSRWAEGELQLWNTSN